MKFIFFNVNKRSGSIFLLGSVTSLWARLSVCRFFGRSDCQRAGRYISKLILEHLFYPWQPLRSLTWFFSSFFQKVEPMKNLKKNFFDQEKNNFQEFVWLYTHKHTDTYTQTHTHTHTHWYLQDVPYSLAYGRASKLEEVTSYQNFQHANWINSSSNFISSVTSLLPSCLSVGWLVGPSVSYNFFQRTGKSYFLSKHFLFQKTQEPKKIVREFRGYARPTVMKFTGKAFSGGFRWLQVVSGVCRWLLLFINFSKFSQQLVPKYEACAN